MRTRNLAIVFTDIAGFTARTARQTHEENRRLLRAHDLLLKPVFRSFGGRVVKAIGDAFLVVFPSPTDAVLCGTAIQDRLWEWNRRAPEDLRLHVRVAVNVGEVRLEKSDVFGAPVNLASRVEALALPGEVLFTEAVWRAIEPGRLPARDLGLKDLRGVPEPVRLFSVEHLDGATSPPYSGLGRRDFGALPEVDDAALKRSFSRRVRTLSSAAALAILALVLAGRSLRARSATDLASQAARPLAFPSANDQAWTEPDAVAFLGRDGAVGFLGEGATAVPLRADLSDRSDASTANRSRPAGSTHKLLRRPLPPGTQIASVGQPRKDDVAGPSRRNPTGSKRDAGAQQPSAGSRDRAGQTPLAAGPKHRSGSHAAGRSTPTRIASAPSHPVSPAAAAAYRDGLAGQERRDWAAAARGFEQAARAGDDRGRDQLLAMLARPWCKARLSAAESLGRLGDQRAAPKLKSLIADADLPDEGSGLTMFDCSSKRAATDALDRLTARASR